jgi:hypothetical protein
MISVAFRLHGQKECADVQTMADPVVNWLQEII